MKPGASMALMAALAIAATVGGCGGDDEPKTVTESVTETETATAEEAQPKTGGAGAGGEAKVAKAAAEQSARKEASSQLERQPGGFAVAESEWQVSCSGGESGGTWNCRLDQGGPCSGTATVTPRPDGMTVTVAKVGCIAD